MENNSEIAAPKARQPYEAPFVEELGTVAELAQGGNPSVFGDAGMNNMFPN